MKIHDNFFLVLLTRLLSLERYKYGPPSQVYHNSPWTYSEKVCSHLAAQAFVNVSDATDEKQEGSEEGKRWLGANEA